MVWDGAWDSVFPTSYLLSDTEFAVILLHWGGTLRIRDLGLTWWPGIMGTGFTCVCGSYWMLFQSYLHFPVTILSSVLFPSLKDLTEYEILLWSVYWLLCLITKKKIFVLLWNTVSSSGKNASSGCHARSLIIIKHCFNPHVLCVLHMVWVIHHGKFCSRELGNPIIKWWTHVLCSVIRSHSNLFKIDGLQSNSVKGTISIDYILDIGMSCHQIYSFLFEPTGLRTITKI